MIGFGYEEDCKIEMAELYKDENGELHGKGMKYKRDGTKKAQSF
jgi:hypothetical protein